MLPFDKESNYEMIMSQRVFGGQGTIRIRTT